MTTPDLSAILESRGIAEIAHVAKWEPAQLYGRWGWLYPVTSSKLTGQQRWKSFDGERPKYLWQPKEAAERPRYYFLNGLKAAIANDNGRLYIASGEPDVLVYNAVGAPNVLCWFGEQNVPETLVANLKALGVVEAVYAYDRDDTGQLSANEVQARLDGAGIKLLLLKLPGELGSHYDINKLWIDVQFDTDTFWQRYKTLEVVNADRRHTDIDWELEYETWCKDIERQAVNAWKVDEQRHKEWSKRHFSSPVRNDSDPSARWNYETHGFKDFGGTGEFYNTHQVAEILGSDTWESHKARLLADHQSAPLLFGSTRRVSPNGKKSQVSRLSLGDRARKEANEIRVVTSDEAMDTVIEWLNGNVPPTEPILSPYAAMHNLKGMARLWERRKLVYVIGAAGMGKEQPNSALIRTEVGWKSMGEIRVGDRLASVDGCSSVVTGVFPQGVKDVYEFTFSDGRKTRAGIDHLWEIKIEADRAPRIVSTADIIKMLSKKDRTHFPSVRLISGDIGGDSDLPLDPWLLGFLLGDGNFTSITPRFSTGDPEIVERIQGLLPPGYKLVLQRTRKYDYRISGSRGRGKINWLTAILSELGLWGKLSYAKHIPSIYLAASRQQRLELLRGLIDSDGWVETFHAIRFAASSLDLAKDVQTLVRSLGGLCSLSVKKTNHHDSYVLNIRHNDAREFSSLRRKAERITAREAELRLSIRDVQWAGREESTCIMVSHPSHLYITDDYVVTHNTAFLETGADNLRKRGLSVIYWGPEWSPEEVQMKAIARHGGPSFDKQRDAHLWAKEALRKVPEKERHGVPLSSIDNEVAKKVAASVRAWPGKAWYIDKSNLSIELTMRKVIEIAAQARGLGQDMAVFFCDYLQKAKLPRSHGRWDELENKANVISYACIEADLVGVVASQVGKNDSRQARKNTQLDASSAQGLSDQLSNLYITINPVFDHDGNRLEKGVIRVEKNSSGYAPSAVTVKTALYRHYWSDELTSIDLEKETPLNEPKEVEPPMEEAEEYAPLMLGGAF